MENQNKEQEIYKSWESQGLFSANPNSDKEPYSLLMPPPNLTGDLHLGHAMQHSILDAVARYKRMQGFDVLLLPGVDHAGIQFEGTLDKILAKEDLSKQKLGREKWLERAWQFKDEVYKSFHDAWTVFGISADWEREVFTLEPKVQKAVLEEFQTFWDQDLLYKGAYIVQWCPRCGTAIEDIEMEYQERDDTLYYLQYGPLVLATTRPETKFGDTAMAVNPNDERYKDLVGKEFEIETFGGKKMMKVIADDAIDPEFGTGAEKVTPGHDILDYEIGKRHNLPILQVIDKQGRLTELAGKYAGMKTNEAREAMLPELKEKGILVKTEAYKHSVPVCERCKTVVEPIISEEWFVKMKPLAKKAIKNIDKINFYPSNYKKILVDWMENIHDWSISRSLWWGHRIPVWYCSKCNPNKEVGKDKDMVISLEDPGKNCQTCGQKHWIQDEQVLDTWFSSGLWPMSTLGWPNQTKELERYFPWSFELTSPEIKYLWIARMIMLSLWHKDSIPFRNMFFHGMLRPLSGAKFSKSLGNAVYPDELIKSWGTDATRMTLYTYSAPGRDSRTSKQLMDERAKNFRNFGNKIRNIAKFVVDHRPDPAGVIARSSATKQSNHKDDKWILEELNSTITAATKNIENFELHLATDTIYDFVWHKFADIYIEKSKSRRAEAQPTLEYILETSLKLLHPFMPFLTEELWQEKLGKKDSIMSTPWPDTKGK
ncbi:MAG: valine--tRNA ligase [Patescibacteria group bacterium]